MIYLSRKKNGYVTLQFIQILSAFFILVFTFVFLSFVGQTKMEFRSACLSESIALQKKIIKSEKLLFSFNKYSTFLSTERKALEAAQLAGIIFLPLGVCVETALKATKLLQQALDKAQKALIQSTNALINLEKVRIAYELNKNAQNSRSQWSQYLSSLFVVTWKGSTKMSVEAKSSDIAPNYGLTSDYKEAQTVAFNWHLAFYTNNDSQRLVDSKNAFELSCGTTAEKENDTWSVEIKKDKY